jgi:hypothetical protein
MAVACASALALGHHDASKAHTGNMSAKTKGTKTQRNNREVENKGNMKTDQRSAKTPC